jgi:hypothetical protein
LIQLEKEEKERKAAKEEELKKKLEEYNRNAPGIYGKDMLKK